MKEFQQRIRGIEDKIIDLTWPGELFKYVDFIEVYEKPLVFLDIVLQCMASREVSEQQKLIIALSMQRLPLNSYLNFGTGVVSCFKHKKITEKVLKWSLLPTYDWNTLLVDNYQDENVQELLNLICLLEISPTLKEYIQTEVLTGKASETVENLRDSGQLKEKID